MLHATSYPHSKKCLQNVCTKEKGLEVFDFYPFDDQCGSTRIRTADPLLVSLDKTGFIQFDKNTKPFTVAVFVKYKIALNHIKPIFLCKSCANFLVALRCYEYKYRHFIRHT